MNISRAVTVSTSATALTQAPALRAVAIRNTGSVTVYVGGSNVTTTNGFPLDPGDVLALDAAGLGGYVSPFYGIVATGSGEARILEVT